MKHEDVPGYTDLRAELFSARFQLQVAKTEEDVNAAKERVNEVRRKLTKFKFEHRNDKTEEEVKKGRR